LALELNLHVKEHLHPQVSHIAPNSYQAVHCTSDRDNTNIEN
jgi:hypothetical protein